MHQSLLARVFVKSGEFGKVLDIYERVYAQAELGSRLARVLELSLFKAVALQELGKTDDAFTVFKKCLTLAEPERFVLLFQDAGEAVIPLLQRAQVEGLCTEYVSKLLTVFNGQQAGAEEEALTIPSQGDLIEPLTERELEVLRLMCMGHSNQQIADEIIVSVNTVKKHTSNIYGKLGVRNRAQAVLRAREIELV
jgi:LuxR family maltose regulon positive regulatory protein